MSRGKPTIDVFALPADEVGIASAINNALSSLDTYVGNFETALSLFKFCQNQISARCTANVIPNFDEIRIFQDWSTVAARDGAMTMYHFICAIEGIKACMHRCPSLNKSYDKKLAKTATTTFSRNFPNCEDMRHAIAHQAELSASPEKLAQNAFSGTKSMPGFNLVNSKDAMVTDCMHDDTYISTINKNIISYEINDTSLLKLRHTKNEIFDSFIVSEFVSRPKLRSDDLRGATFPVSC